VWQPGNMMGVRAGGVDHVTALCRAATGGYALHSSAGAIDLINSRRRREPHTNFAALMLIGSDYASGCHLPIRWTPKNGFGLGEIHSGPQSRGFLLFNQVCL